MYMVDLGSLGFRALGAWGWGFKVKDLGLTF